MNRPHDDINAVLKGLSSAEATPGMEERILDVLEQRAQVLEQHALAATPSVWRRALGLDLATSSPLRRPALSFTLAAMLAFALALPAIHHRRHAPTIAIQTRPLPSARQRPAAEATAQTASAPQLTRHPLRKTRFQAANLLQSPDSLALSEMRAPSMPAPPLPLTRQEKLLLRVAHKGDPEPETILDGELRAKQEAEQQADFDTFFGKLKNPAASDTE